MAGIAVCLAGSLVGTVFGLLAAHEAINPAQGAQIAIVATITAMTGLFAGVAIPAWKIWLEFREKTKNDLREIMQRIFENQEAFKETIAKINVIIANQEAFLKQQGIKEQPKQ
jgi:biopolymer transport protein ExbB/TolQ